MKTFDYFMKTKLLVIEKILYNLAKIELLRFLVALFITSLLVDKANLNSLSFHDITCIHVLHICLDFAPKNIPL